MPTRDSCSLDTMMGDKRQHGQPTTFDDVLKIQETSTKLETVSDEISKVAIVQTASWKSFTTLAMDERGIHGFLKPNYSYKPRSKRTCVWRQF